MFKTNGIASHIGDSGKAISSLSSAFYNKKWIVHGTDFSLPIASKKFRRVSTIHDLGVYQDALMDGKFSSRGQRKIEELMSRRPDRIIVPSRFVKGEFLTRFPNYTKKTFVVNHGCDHLIDSSVGNLDMVNELTSRPFILFVGNLEKRKNLLGAIKAYEQVRQMIPSLDFVVVGKDGYQAEVIHKAIQSSPFSKDILVVGHAKDALIKALYQRCQCFVYPSLYEGFGMPVIEAMTLGAAVVTSRATATMEISGPGAHLVNPTSIDDIAQGILKILQDPQYKSQLVLAATEYCKNLSWIQTARETIEVYKSL